jgi:hypothetical protein
LRRARRPLPEHGQRERRVKRLGTQLVEDIDLLVHAERPTCLVPAIQRDPRELAHVADEQLPVIRQLEREVDVAVARRARGEHEHLAGHLDLEREHHTARQLEHQPLGPPRDLRDLAADDTRRECIRIGMLDGAWPVGHEARDGRAQHERAQLAGDGLDFGQLGHARQCTDARPTRDRYVSRLAA